jgi:hypothetical protein
MDEGQDLTILSKEELAKIGRATKAARKAAGAAQRRLARAGRLSRMASSFPGTLVDVPLQPRPEGSLPSRSPNLISQLAQLSTLSRRDLAAALEARVIEQGVEVNTKAMASLLACRVLGVKLVRRLSPNSAKVYLSAKEASRLIKRMRMRAKRKSRRVELEKARERKAFEAAMEVALPKVELEMRLEYLAEEKVLLDRFWNDIETSVHGPDPFDWKDTGWEGWKKEGWGQGDNRSEGTGGKGRVGGGLVGGGLVGGW